MEIFQATIECSNSCYIETYLIVAKDKTEADKLLCMHEKRKVKYTRELQTIKIDLTKPNVIPSIGFGYNSSDNGYDD